MKNLVGFVKRRYILISIGVLAVLFIGWRFNASKKGPALVAAHTVQLEDIRQSVLATGTVTSQSNLNLSFKNTGVLTRLNAKVGDKVRTGQVLAMLDEKDVSASINQASASVLAAKANYNKVLNGASNAEVDVARSAVAAAQVTLSNAKSTYDVTVSQQKTAVANAQSAMFNAGLAANPVVGNSGGSTVTVSGTYSDTQTGQYKISILNSGAGLYYSISGLESFTGPLNKGVPLPIGTKGLYFTFNNSGVVGTSDSWTIDIPNTQSSSYLTAANAYQTALQTQAQTTVAAKGAIDSAQAALLQSQAQLALKQTTARPEDVQAAQAQIATANAQLQTAQNQYSNNIISSPIDGVVTSVDLKLGENIPAQKAVIVVLDAKSLHVETNISESSISNIKADQSVEMTLDAFGPDRYFSGQVLSIDPASTVVSGVINYRVVSSLPNTPEIKPGMTANLTILIAEKDHVLGVPSRLIKTVGDKKYVSVLQNGKASDVEITTGLVGDSLTEVYTGVEAGTVIAADPKKSGG
jgi:RND family efflux transporter MFP subunit